PWRRRRSPFGERRAATRSGNAACRLGHRVEYVVETVVAPADALLHSRRQHAVARLLRRAVHGVDQRRDAVVLRELERRDRLAGEVVELLCANELPRRVDLAILAAESERLV